MVVTVPRRLSNGLSQISCVDFKPQSSQSLRGDFIRGPWFNSTGFGKISGPAFFQDCWRQPSMVVRVGASNGSGPRHKGQISLTQHPNPLKGAHFRDIPGLS